MKHGMETAAEEKKVHAQPETESLVKVESLVKRYGAHVAVDNLSFAMDRGKVYGFVGPNGAGKSTTMNVMTGYIGPTSGRVLIDGYDICEEPLKAKARIGYLPERAPLYPEMTAAEYLRFAAELKRIPAKGRKEAVQSVLAATHTEHVAQRLIRNLSKGYQQRVGIAQALLGSPDLVIMDEPTVGLDPKQMIEIRNLIRELGRRHTVILSSHILSEISAICDHILIISHGKLVASDTPENLGRMLAAANTVEATVRGQEETVRGALGGLQGIRSFTLSETKEGDAYRVRIEQEPESDIFEPLSRAFSEAGCPILKMEQASADLEDVFLELTAEKENSGKEENKDACSTEA